MKRFKLFIITIVLLVIIGIIIQIISGRNPNNLDSNFKIASINQTSNFKSSLLYNLKRDDEIKRFILLTFIKKGLKEFKTNGLFDEYMIYPYFVNHDRDDFFNTITDIDGNVYYTMTFGKQVWMIENLKTTRYSNGDSIETTIPKTLDISSENNPKYQWSYPIDEKSSKSYGRLYTWYAIKDKRGLAPDGWHIPTDKEWFILVEYLGGHKVAGIKFLKIISTYMKMVDKNIEEKSLEKILTGLRSAEGQFYGRGSVCHWWSSDQFDKYCGAYWGLELGSNVLCWLDGRSNEGLSVLCIKDSKIESNSFLINKK